jgi:Domain of unknown function (DUF4145)
MAFNWTCPYCSRLQTVTDSSFSEDEIHFDTAKSSKGYISVRATAVVCSNPECLEPCVSASVYETSYANSTPYISGKAVPLLQRQVLPESMSRPQPDFIPVALRQDYLEACLIRDLSPKASATLSRRCIQGMIRDFAGISRGTLAEEIRELGKRVADGVAPKGVSEESVEAIDHVRSIGNIGAHMEKDINLIVSIEADEAQILIELIESLFDEWYVARKKREQRFASVKNISEQKKADKQS